MPYRAILTTLVSLMIALLATYMWVRAMQPMVQQASTQPGWQAPLTAPANAPNPEAYRPPPERELKVLVKGTGLLALVLILVLLLVGFAYSSVREWIRYHTSDKPARRRPRKTQYVDAWKIAGERLTPGPPPPPAPPHE